MRNWRGAQIWGLLFVLRQVLTNGALDDYVVGFFLVFSLMLSYRVLSARFFLVLYAYAVKLVAMYASPTLILPISLRCCPLSGPGLFKAFIRPRGSICVTAMADWNDSLADLAVFCKVDLIRYASASPPSVRVFYGECHFFWGTSLFPQPWIRLLHFLYRVLQF
jgi:hypothetical protein